MLVFARDPSLKRIWVDNAFVRGGDSSLEPAASTIQLSREQVTESLKAVKENADAVLFKVEDKLSPSWPRLEGAF